MKLKPVEIFAAVAGEMKLPAHAVYERTRCPEHDLMRLVCVYLARELTGLSFPKIAREMRRTHSAAVMGNHRLAQLLEADSRVTLPRWYQRWPNGARVSEVVERCREACRRRAAESC